MGLAYSFRGLDHYYHVGTWQCEGKYGVGEGFRVLHLDPQAAEGDCHTRPSLSIYEISKLASTMTHFLRQGYTYVNKAMPPNSATPYGSSIQTHESLEIIAIQIITNT